MKIDLHSTIGSIPLRQIKRVFKKNEYIDAQFFGKELNIDHDRANALIAELCAQGFLEKDELKPNRFVTSRNGKRLAATSAQRISNLKAWQLFGSFMERLEHVNSQRSEFAFWVDRVVLAGSFLMNQEQSDFGDIDLFIRLKPKHNDPQRQNELNGIRILATNRHFSTVLNQLNWPRHEVVKFLKNRSKYLSITDNYDSHLELEPKNCFSVIYEANAFPAKDISV